MALIWLHHKQEQSEASQFADFWPKQKTNYAL